MASPSLIPSQYNTNLKLAVEKEGGWAAAGLTSSDLASIFTSADLASVLTPADFMSLFPVGSVMMWNDQDTVPTGWQIVAGSHGYNLMAIETGDAYTTGGTTSYPISAHSVTQPTAHSPAATGTPSATIGSLPDTGVNIAAHQTHTHQTPSLSHTGAAVGAHTTLDVQPPYIQIFLIEKVA